METIDKRIVDSHEALVLNLSAKLRQLAKDWVIPNQSGKAAPEQWEDWQHQFWEIRHVVDRLQKTTEV